MSTLFSATSERRFRRDARDFTRGGPLDPELLITLLLYMVADGNRRGYQHLLEGFWDEARGYGLPLPSDKPVTAPSFCTARHKITSELLRHLIHEVAEHFFGAGSDASQRWRGRRVFAVDGSKINLQRAADLEQAFGVPPNGYCPQVLMSTLVDVCTRAPVDVEVSPSASNERDHLLSMLPRLEPGDVLVLDRGYPSHQVLQAIVEAGVDFLARVPRSSSFAVVDDLRESSGDDYMYWLEPREGSPASWSRLKVRVVRLRTPQGDESFFITSLRRSEFSRARLRELYHMRWEVEEFYKLFQGPYIGQGQFRSKSPSGVRQEIHALVLFLLITRVFMAAAAKASGSSPECLSMKAATLGLATYVTRLFLATDPDYALREFRALLERLARAPYKRRPGRSSPRRSFLPRRRWGPGGRIGG